MTHDEQMRDLRRENTELRRENSNFKDALKVMGESDFVKLDDVIDAIHEIYYNEGFRDYSDYSQLFDNVSSLQRLTFNN